MAYQAFRNIYRQVVSFWAAMMRRMSYEVVRLGDFLMEPWSRR